MKTTFLAFLTLVSFSFLVSCKGKQGDVGPAGQNGKDANTWTSKEGSIKGTATGTTLDGSNFSYSLDFEGNLNGASNNYRVLSSGVVVEIEKVYAGEGDSFVSGDIYIRFNIPDLNSLSSPQLESFIVDLTKDLGNNKFYRAYFDDTVPGSNISISNLSYNSNTGVLTGNYSSTFPASSIEGSLNITNGTFSTKLSQTVAKMSAVNY